MGKTKQPIVVEQAFLNDQLSENER